MPRHRSGSGHDTKHHRMPRNTCFGCGPDNPDGMKLKFALDEERQRFVGRFRIPKRYQGPPGHVHGGIIATILDEAMGKVNELRHVIALTRHMEVEFLKPVPLGKLLIVEGHEVGVDGRKHTNAAEICNEAGEVLARSQGTFIAIDPQKMFEKHLPKSGGTFRKH